MRIAPNLNITGPPRATDSWISQFIQMLKNIYNNLAQAINGNLTFGDGTFADNMLNAWVNTTTPATPNTDFTVTHNLGKIPAGYIVMEKDRAVDVYTGSVPATDTQLTLRANTASAVIRLFIIGILLVLLSPAVRAQGDYFHDIALYNRGNANAGVIASPLITVCLGVQSLTVIPCAGPTAIFSCPAVDMTCPQANPFNGDFNGNFSFWALASQTYTISIQGVGVNGFNYYYTAPIVFGGQGTFSDIVSASANPAQSGFIRMATFDQICWRNAANTADICINKDGSDNLFFGAHQFPFLDTTNAWLGSNLFTTGNLCVTGGSFSDCFLATPSAFRSVSMQDASGTMALLEVSQSWAGSPQIFNMLEWKSGTVNAATLAHANTAPRTYTFPDLTDNVVLRSSTDTLTNKTLTTPVINGATTGTGVQGTDIRLLSGGSNGASGAILCRDSLGGADACGTGHTLRVEESHAAPGCTTGSSSSFDSCTYTLTWTVPFPDANYGVTCTANGAGYNQGSAGLNNANFIYTTTKLAASVNITIQNGRGASDSPTEVDCTAIHN